MRDSVIGPLFCCRVGNVGEWNLSNGDLIEHKVHDCAVCFIALIGDMIVACDGSSSLQVFSLPASACLLVLYS